MEPLGVAEKPEKLERKFEMKHASTCSIRKDGGCVVCGDEKHREKFFFCKRFKDLSAWCCKKRMMNVEARTCAETDSRRGSSSDHHFFLGPQGESRKGEEDKQGGKDSRKRHKLT